MEWSAPGYTEIRQLGAGASGRVTLAVHDETGVKVAIKYLSARLRRDPAALARFQSEARLLTTLRDPNIATIWEYIQDADGACIVMELVDGVSLRALLRENGATEPEAALVVLKGSLLGLARAHDAGLVHKDYKPENVLVRGDGVSKLVDFGIAVHQGTVARPEGTPPYMAPELWEGLPASPATDVYAATAVFFECLTGHRPYRSTEPSVLGYQHLHAPVPVHDAPGPVRGLIERGLAKDPARRPAGARAFVAELEATARAAYGEDWEERGRRRLAALVALLAFLLPSAEAPPPEATTSLARTVFRGLHANARRVAMGGALATAAAVAVVVVVLAARQSPPPAEPIGAAAAVPPSQAATPGTPDTPAPSGTPGTPTAPEETPAQTPSSTREAAATPPVTPLSTPQKTPLKTPLKTPSENPATTPAKTPGKTPVKTPAKTPTKTPVKTPSKTPGQSPRPTVEVTPTRTPTPTLTTAPVTRVLGVSVGGLTVGEKGVARGTVTVRTSGTAAVTATASWAMTGADGRTQRLRLSGARSYTRALTWSMRERPCGATVTLTVTTSPAAPGGARSASLAVPPCPTRVTGLRVSLSLPDAPGRTATAQVRVATSGTGEVPVQARFAVGGDAVGTRTASLSGRTSYARSFTHTFRSRPCGATVSVRVTAGGRTATARASVPCPPRVRQVSIVRAAYGDGVIVATVAVTTSDARPVRLVVSFAAGEGGGSESVTLSGRTSYTTTLRQAVKASCGARWSVTAATDPAAAGGSDSAGGRTEECPKEEEPDRTPSPRSDDTIR